MKESERHLRAEELIDVLEGTPIEAVLHRHAIACELCLGEIRQLREAIHAVRGVEVPDPGPRYWSRLAARIGGRVEGRPETPNASSPSRAWLWVAAASMVATLSAWLSWTWIVRPPAVEPKPPMVRKTILPTVEDDAEYRFLRSVVELSEAGESIPEESLEPQGVSMLDLSALDAEERQGLRQWLERALDPAGEGPSAES